jgi:hypothetical protein
LAELDLTRPGIPGLVAGYETDSGVSVSGARVTGWADLSGSGNHLAAAGDPTLVAGATPTGAAAVSFDGVGDLLSRTGALSALPGGAGDRTMFLVVRYGDAEGVSSGFAYGDGARNQAFGLMTHGANQNLMVQGYSGANDFTSDIDGPAQGWMVQSVVLDDNLVEHFLNGTLIDSQSHSYATDLQRVVMGAEIGRKGESQLYIAAGFIFNRALGDADRAAMEDYLQAKYVAGGPQTQYVVLDASSFVADGTAAPQEWGDGVVLTGYDWFGNPAPLGYDKDFRDFGVGLFDGRFRQFDFSQELGNISERLEIDFGGLVSNVVVRFGEMHPSEGGFPETGVWTAYDAAGNEVGTGLISSEHSTLGVNVKVAGSFDTYPVAIDADVPIARLVIEATNLGYGAGTPFDVTTNPAFWSKVSYQGVPFEQNTDFNIPRISFARVTYDGANALPVAVDDSYEIDGGETLSVTAPGLLDNDTDADGEPLTVAGFDPAANGTLSVAPDGSFTYTPDSGFYGTETIRYSISDGAATDQGTLSIRVVNPTAGPERPHISGLVAGYEADSGVAATGARVTSWADLSGSGNHLTAVGDPMLVAGATPGGAAAVSFDGVGDLLSRTGALSSLPGGAGDRTMFLVVRYRDAEGVSSGLAYGDGARNQAFGLMTNQSSQDLMVQGYGTTNDITSDVDGPAQDWIVQSVVLDDNFVEHFLNGALIDSQSHRYATDLQRVVMGAEIAGKGESQLDIAAGFIFNRALDDVDRMAMEDYLESKYLDTSPNLFVA